MSGGSFSGSGGGSYTFPIKGTISGQSVTLTDWSLRSAAELLGDVHGQALSNGKTMSGTWTSNEHQAGTWTATLTTAVRKP
jgi:hypothetical protein